MFRSSTSLTDSEAQVGFLFHVMIGVNPLGEFRAVRGLGRTIDHHEIKEGGRNHSPHLRVGPAKYEPCTIEWGMSNRTTLYDWIHAVEAGYGYKRQVWIIQLSRERTPLRIYQLIDAFPISWEGAELNANDNVVDTEQIKIVYEAVMLLTIPQVINNLPSFTLPDVAFDEDTGARTMAGEYEIVRPGAPPTAGLDDGERLKREEPGRIAFTEEEDEADDDEPTPTPLRKVTFTKDDDEKLPEDKPDEPLTLSGGAEVAPSTTAPIAFVAPVGDKDDDEKDKDEAGEKEEKRKTGAGLTLSGGTFVAHEDPATEAASGGEPAKRPEPVKLKLSGGVFFAPAVFATDDL